jgi:hypothetical protein
MMAAVLPGLPLTLSLFARAALAQGAVAAAALSVWSVAAWVEGRPPDLASARALVPALAAAIGVGAVLWAWQREAGDVALASLGHHPSSTLLALTLAAVPVLAAGTAPTRTPAADGIELGPAEVAFAGQTVRWVDGIATRGDGQAFPGLPPPSGGPAAPAATRPAFVARLGALVLLVCVLGLLRPALPLVLLLSGSAAGAVEVWLRWPPG